MERDWWSPDDNPAPAVREFVGTVNAVASQEQAIKLRAARILAWMKTKDLSPLNVPGWTACVEEYSPGPRARRASTCGWRRATEIIREAAVAKVIDLAAAGRALSSFPGRESGGAVGVRGEGRERPAREMATSLPGRDLGRRDAPHHPARDLGHIFIGWPASTATIDSS